MMKLEYTKGVLGDRAYWLDAQRRYFPQDMATDYIGFRCAMSRVGPKADRKKSPKLIFLYHKNKSLIRALFFLNRQMDISYIHVYFKM
jgi:hypothetical protein